MLNKSIFFFLSTCFFNVGFLWAQEHLNEKTQDSISTSIFLETEVTKSYFYNSLWGQRYRQAYATPINAAVIDLDNYEGGLQVVKQLEGQYSRKLLLTNTNQDQYILRALRKTQTDYLSNQSLKENYNQGEFKDTYAADFIDDLGTGAHPYISLVVSALARDLEIPYRYSSLVYVPKTGDLNSFSDNFGDELYYIEKQIPSEILNNHNLAINDTIVNTAHVLSQLRAAASNTIDEEAYIRARIFDMLIGDWNRSSSKWDWVKASGNKSTTYIPISKNSDQAFSKMGDGPLMRLTTFFSKNRRHLENYNGELTNPKWLNKSAYALDKALITNLDTQFWEDQTTALTSLLTDEVIAQAFARVPQELESKLSEEIISHLKQRRDNLPQLTNAYLELLSKLVIIKGTANDDHFKIIRQADGTSEISVKTKGRDVTTFYQNTIKPDKTKQVWIYGLDGKDTFEVQGPGSSQVSVSIFGGEGKDIYTIANDRGISLYDNTSQSTQVTPSTIKVKRIDDKEAGAYNYLRTKRYSNKVRPLLGVNVDDGLRIGLENTFTDYGFQHTPFSQQHTLGASFYFATSGFDVQYSGEWTHVFKKFDLGLDAQITSPNYTLNFFGFGNETVNLNREDPETFKLNYNRVRIQRFSIAPSISYRDPIGYSLKAAVSYSKIAIDQTENRFIELFYNSNTNATENQFVALTVSAAYDDKAQDLIPIVDVQASITAGNAFNSTESTNAVFVNPKLTIGLPFDKNERVALISRLASYINLNENIEFYQGASLGADNGLRGYRNQRFTGINSFVQSSDLRLKLNRLQTKWIPIDLGIYGGFDHGRVWVNNDLSADWKTAIGGGVFFNTSSLLVGDLSVFHSEEGLRAAVRVGVGF